MTDVVTRLVVRADGSLAVLDQFGKKMSDAGAAADRATGGVARYEAAQRKMQEAQQRGLAISTESIARKTREQRVFEQAASAIDKNYALRIRLEREAERSAVAMSNAVAAGYLRQEQALELLMQQEQQHLALLSRGRGGGAAAGGNFSTANIAAQFQDVGVTAAMGMNPLQIALQQGTQLSAVLATMEKPLEGIVTGLKSLITPLSLMTIGIIALVAVGLQFVDWGAVAETTLNMLAEGLEVIAPYAAAAAVGLALLYSPAILSGLVTVVGSLGTVAKAIWGIATAIYATVGLPALLIAGFVAIVAGTVIWRDELTKMLGVDIVGAAQDGINWIIGAFVGGFNAIKETWSLLPAAIGDLVMQAVNNTIGGVESMINFVGEKINEFIRSINDAIMLVPEQFRMGWTGLGEVGKVTFGRAPNPYEGKAGEVAGIAEQAFKDAQGYNYVGEAVTFVQDAASGASDALRGLADSIGVDEKASKAAAKEAERQAEAYRDLTRDAEQFIAGQHLAAQALGMSEEAANRMRYEQDMLNKAANDNIKLSAAQRAEIAGLASEMAAAEESTRRLTEIYDLGKEVFSSFFADMKSGLREGQSFWEALGNAGANALDKIADRALTMAADGLFDMIFGAFTGGFGGGKVGGVKGGLLGGAIIPGILHSGGVAGTDGYSHSRAFSPAIWANAPRYHNGTDFAGLRPGEVPAILQRGERVIPANQNAVMSGSGYIDVRAVVEVVNGNLVPVITKVSGEVAGKMVKPVSQAVDQMAQQQRFG